MPLLKLIQGSPEWHAYRKGKIGASLAPVIMGVSPWQTPLQLWEEMLEIRPPREKTAAMDRGLKLENEARELFSKEIGFLVSPEVFQHDSIDWMFASLDGYRDWEGPRIIVEIKCPGKEDHAVAQNGMIPEKYFPQLQHQMAVTSVNTSYYVSYDGTNIVTVEVYRDQEYIERLIGKEAEFIKRVRTFDAPPMTERDVISRQDQAWNWASEHYKKLLRYQKDLEGRIEQAKNNLIELSKGKNCKGNAISLTKIGRKGNVDYSQIPELKEIDLDKYRKPVSSYWKISINGDE